MEQSGQSQWFSNSPLHNSFSLLSGMCQCELTIWPNVPTSVLFETSTANWEPSIFTNEIGMTLSTHLNDVIVSSQGSSSELLNWECRHAFSRRMREVPIGSPWASTSFTIHHPPSCMSCPDNS